MKGILWTKIEDDILYQNYNCKSTKYVKSLLINRTVGAIKSRANYLGIKKEIVSVRGGNIEPLLLDTPEAFYWIGFIFADGSIINDKTRLSVSLAEKDHEHLRKMASFLNTTTKVYIENGGWTDNQPFCKLRIQDKQRVPELCAKFDLKPRKTYNPPNLCINDDDLFISFLCGFIDGDGCIVINKNRKNCINITIKVHGSWFDTLCYIEQRIYSALQLTKYRDNNLTSLNKKGFAVLRLSDNTLIRKLKQRAVELEIPIMNRKWYKIDTKLVSRYITTQQKRIVINNMLESGMYPAQISRELGLKLSTTYGLVRQIKQKEFAKHD